MNELGDLSGNLSEKLSGRDKLLAIAATLGGLLCLGLTYGLTDPLAKDCCAICFALCFLLPSRKRVLLSAFVSFFVFSAGWSLATMLFGAK